MAFLDNSGDIVLDAVLTDTGRHRMARGDFRIAKFALGDDEIDYSLYNKNHPSGSAYYDLEILKTPVLESFTNNASMMKSKLLTIGRTDFLYMPIMKLMDGGNPLKAGDPNQDREYVRYTKLHPKFRSYLVTVNFETDEKVNYSPNAESLRGQGIILGANNSHGQNQQQFTSNPNHIVVETGLDTLDIPPARGLSADLRDEQFIVEMDSRLGSLSAYRDVAPGGNTTTIPPSYIDDDGIASHVANQGLSFGAVDTLLVNAAQPTEQSDSTIRGPRGKILQFSVIPHTNLKDSDYFFDRLGGTFTQASAPVENTAASATNTGFANGTYKYIDTYVRVVGLTTGYTIDIPVRYVKFSSS